MPKNPGTKVPITISDDTARRIDRVARPLESAADTIERVVNALPRRRATEMKGSTLADHMIAAPRDMRRAFGSLHHLMGPTSRARVTEIASTVRASQRTQLDDGFTRLAARVSCLPPSTILRHMPMIVPPSANFWLEWNERVRMDELMIAGYVDRIHEDQAAHRVGILTVCHQLDGGAVMMKSQIVSQHISPGARIPLIEQTIGFWWSPTELPYKDAAASLLSMDDLAMSEAIYDHERSNGCCWALGERWHAMHPTDTAYHEVAKYVAYSWSGVVTSDDILSMSKVDLRNTAIHGAISVNGDLRFLLAVMILMSSAEVLSSEPWTSAGVRAPSTSARLRTPGNTFRTLTCAAPRERVLDRIERYQPPATPTGRHPRDHEVRGHVCRSRRKGSPICEHTFDQPELPHFCTSCGYREWPRKSHRRGDKALGTVFGPRKLTASVGGNVPIFGDSALQRTEDQPH